MERLNIQRFHDNDIKIIKFFPAIISGGVKKLNSIASIFKELNFIPTGGINESNVHSFLELQNVLCVGTSKFDDLISSYVNYNHFFHHLLFHLSLFI